MNMKYIYANVTKITHITKRLSMDNAETFYFIDETNEQVSHNIVSVTRTLLPWLCCQCHCYRCLNKCTGFCGRWLAPVGLNHHYKCAPRSPWRGLSQVHPPPQ